MEMSDDSLAFRAGIIRADCCMMKNEFYQSDSLLNLAKICIKTKRDSLIWLNFKYVLKYRTDDKDSSLYYLKQMQKFRLANDRHLYACMGDVFVSMEQPDSAIAYYKRAVEGDCSRNTFFYYDKLIEVYRKHGKYREGLSYMREWREHMKRSDIPYVNFIQGELYMELHSPDSAFKHYRIASETGNSFIATQAFACMGDILESERNVEGAFRMYHNRSQNFSGIYSKIDEKERRDAFEALKLKNQLNELEVARQEHIIVILGLSLSIAILTGCFILYILYRKRVMERKRLLQENLLLKQQEELSTLREKEALLREQDARMREELFKRMKVFDKIPLAEKEPSEGGKDGGHINLSETDWAEIRLMLDSTYPNFTRKLKQDFPDLTEKDINLCCLIKINVGLQSLADIYCISKNSVSRRKLRMKEKMRIEEGKTLDEFLQNY